MIKGAFNWERNQKINLNKNQDREMQAADQANVVLCFVKMTRDNPDLSMWIAHLQVNSFLKELWSIQLRPLGNPNRRFVEGRAEEAKEGLKE